MDTRGVSPVIGVVSLLAVTVTLAGVVGAGALSFAPPAAPAQATFDVSADAAQDTISVTHAGGDTLDAGSLAVNIRIDDEPLRHQPPVPFVGARGFRGAPSGPFNRADDGVWTAGETATLRLAGTNAPLVESGSTVEIRIYAGETLVVVAETTA
ncbi:type IV pilin [Natronomonas sp. EA1]|uniref:type IV pilin n=1 Tax=Natronomonas sp. EA1 TaxID=3421655 RepID=UPI003EB7C26A